MPIPLLEGLTVVEIGRAVSTRYAGRLLADLGAQVIAIEPDDAEKLGPSPAIEAYLMANKRRAVLPLDRDTMARIHRRADIVLCDRSLADETHLLSGEAAGQCVVAVMTPYGLKGPHVDLHEDELLAFSLSGIASTIPDGAEDRSLERPMQPYGHQGACLTGLVAAVASLQQWLGGHGAVLDISTVDVLGSTLMGEVFNVIPPGQSEGRPRATFRGMLRCQDGYFYASGGDWSVWAQLLSREDWNGPPYDDVVYRAAHWAEISAVAADLLATHNVADLCEAGQTLGIAMFPVNSIADIISDPQLTDRKFFRPIHVVGEGKVLAPTNPIRLIEGRGPAATADVLHARDADTEFARELLLRGVAASDRPSRSPLPLDGTRIADFTWVIAGPQATKWMAALGAEVIKVESRLRPDPTRRFAVSIDGNPEGMEGSPHFLMLNYSKKDCTINLSTAEGRELARRLILSSDIVIENYSTGAAERLGIDFADLAPVKPNLIMVSSSGMGRTGPGAATRAYGTPVQALAGHTYLASWPGTPPRGQGVSWTDPVAGEWAALAMLAGLVYARRVNQPLHFDISMVEITVALMFEAYIEELVGQSVQPVGNRTPDCAPHNTYLCKDGWIAIAAHDDAEWRSLAALVGPSVRAVMTLAERLRDLSAIDAALDAWCASYTVDDVLQALKGAEVCAARVLEVTKVADSDHYRKRDLMVELNKPGVGSYLGYKVPWKAEPPAELIYEPAPRMGQDNDYVFHEVLGLTDADIERLGAANVFR